MSQLDGRRVRLAEAQDWRCAYCAGAMGVRGEHPASVTLEHLTPRAQGGTGSLANLIAACRACNHARGSLAHPDDFSRVRRRWARNGRWPPCTPLPYSLRALFHSRLRDLERNRRLAAAVVPCPPDSAGGSVVASPGGRRLNRIPTISARASSQSVRR